MCHMFSESIQKKIGKCKDSFDQGQAGGRSNCRSPDWQTKTKNRFFRKQEQSNDKSGFADPKPQYRRNDRRKYNENSRDHRQQQLNYKGRSAKTWAFSDADAGDY